MDILPSNSGLSLDSNKHDLVDRLFSKSFLLTCVLATIAVVSAGLAQADEKKEKDLRINVQLGHPGHGYYHRAPVQQVVVRPAPVVIYEDRHHNGNRHRAPVVADRHHDGRGHGHDHHGHASHRNNGRYSHIDHGHGHHRNSHYDQPQARYYVPAHQVWRGGVWMTVPGFYTTNYVAPIPAPLYEPQPRYVTPGWLWVRGHWGWGGVEWNWAPGAWVRL
jgi:hypothetical protein